MDGAGERGIWHGGWAVREDLMQAVGREFTNSSVELAVLVLAAGRGSVGQSLVNEINPVVAVPPARRNHRYQPSFAASHDVELRVGAPGFETITGEFGMWVHFFFVDDPRIAEGLKRCYDQGAERVSNEIVGLKLPDLGQLPVQPDTGAEVSSWNSELFRQVGG
jgi:hypothetical protein